MSMFVVKAGMIWEEGLGVTEPRFGLMENIIHPTVGDITLLFLMHAMVCYQTIIYIHTKLYTSSDFRVSRISAYISQNITKVNY